MTYAPIVLFAFNRLESLKATVASLLTNAEASSSDLFVFVDGPRANHDDDKARVSAVQDYVRTISGFNSISYAFSDHNKGLGPSIIDGVTRVINQYGSAIVLEDDLKLTDNFLTFMNQGLELYRGESRVWSVCGHSNQVRVPAGYVADSYFCTRFSSWGWATWLDRWNKVDWNLRDWHSVTQHHREFNKWGGSDCYGMLKEWHDGKNMSWAIRFCYAQFLQDCLSLLPIQSKVVNEGFDGEGTNCKKWSRFKSVTDNTHQRHFVWPKSVELNKTLFKSAMSYHGIAVRIWSRLMYILHS